MIPTCQKAKNRRTSCMRHQRHRAPHFTPTGEALWAVATQKGGFPWTAGRQRAAAKGFPAEGRCPVLSRSLLAVPRTAPRYATAIIRPRRLVSPSRSANSPTLRYRRRPVPRTRDLLRGWQLWAITRATKFRPESETLQDPHPGAIS